MLKERYQEIQEYKELFGDEFQDFNLVFCNAHGRPMESQIITRALQKLIKDSDHLQQETSFLKTNKEWQ